MEVYKSPLHEFWAHLKKNKGAVAGLTLIITFLIISIFSPIFAPHDPTNIFSDFLKLPPAWETNGKLMFPLGTDDLGRDVLSRLIYGARISLGIGTSVVLISGTIGTILGLISGFYEGLIDKIIMGIIDIIMAFPSILLAIVVVSIIGPGIMNAIIAVSVVAIPSFTRIVRGSVLVEKKKQYVQASKTFGANDLRIMFLEILPNCLAPLIVQATLGVSDGILNAAALGFLGLGAQPPTPEWGTMLSDAKAYIESAPWIVTLPGICILVTVLSFNLLGDGLRDALDPKLKK